ncbi:MAG: enoyl-CoA hydratase/isomerase family protein [Dehalococcoidia bacterium]|nr:enoyl-CoA hydratase/isomerase family protein [Dehalococcoidia bacterium]
MPVGDAMGSDTRLEYGDGLVVRSDDGPVATVLLNRPGRRNALDRQTLVSLAEALAELRADASVRVVVLTGEGAAFCAGVDISPDAQRTFYGDPQPIERLYQEHGQGIVRTLQMLPQVTVARVNGPAIGWGACLATCCDFRVAAADAFFRIPEIGLGMYYDVGCLYGLIALIGGAEAKRMTMLGVDVDAQDALRMGLVDFVARDGMMQSVLDELIGQLLRRGEIVLRTAKRQVYAATVGRTRPLSMLELELTTFYAAGNRDRYEGLAAGREQRAPRFSEEQLAGTLTRPQQRGEGGDVHGLPSD